MSVYSIIDILVGYTIPHGNSIRPHQLRVGLRRVDNHAAQGPRGGPGGPRHVRCIRHPGKDRVGYRRAAPGDHHLEDPQDRKDPLHADPDGNRGPDIGPTPFLFLP